MFIQENALSAYDINLGRGSRPRRQKPRQKISHSIDPMTGQETITSVPVVKMPKKKRRVRSINAYIYAPPIQPNTNFTRREERIVTKPSFTTFGGYFIDESDMGLGKSWKKKFKKITKAPQRLIKAVKKSPLLLFAGMSPLVGGAAIAMKGKTRKKLFKPIAKMAGKTVKAVAGVVTAPARMMVGGMQTGMQFGKALFKKKPKEQGGEEIIEAAPVEVAPEAVAPGEEVVETTEQGPEYAEQEYGPAEAPDYGGGQAEYAAPAQTSEMPSYPEEEIEAPEETAEEVTEPEVVAPEEAPSETATGEENEITAGRSATMFSTEQEGGTDLMLSAVGLAGDLGIAPAVVAVGAKFAQSGAGKKILGGIGKLFKKKKKGAAPVAPPAPVPGLKKIPSVASSAMPKWILPVGVGVVALLIVSQMGGGGSSERRQITVIK